MKSRIAVWAGSGFAIAVAWALYALATHPPSMTSADPILPLVQLTCPIVFASSYFHFGVSLYWSLVANAVTYSLIGLLVESSRHRLKFSQ